MASSTAKSPGMTVQSQPVKKFQVSALKAVSHVDMAAAVQIWGELHTAITQIYRQNASALSFEALHRRAYTLTLHKHGELLYEGVSKTIKEHLSAEAAVLRTVPDSLLLRRFQEAWESHSRDILKIRDILMYMERAYVVTNRKLGTLDLGTTLFRDTVLRDDNVQPRVRRLLLDAMRDARECGRLSESLLLRHVLGILVELGLNATTVYADEFERAFLAQTEAFYHDEAADVLGRSGSGGSTVEFLKYAERRIAEEHARAAEVLHPSTLPRLVDLVQRQLIAAHALRLVEMEGSGFLFLLEHERFDDLRRMYRLFAASKSLVSWKGPHDGRERSLPPAALLRDTMKGVVVSRGAAIVHDSEARKDPVLLVQALLDLRDKFARVIDTAFDSDKDFHRALKDAFEIVMNADGGDERRPTGSGVNVCAEFLSVYVDEHMKRLFRDLPDAEVEARLNKVITLFRFLRDKDVFEAYYKQHLTKRLLGNRTSSEDFERLMLSKLKTECGFQYTSKLEGMFNDLKTSSDFLAVYRRERQTAAGDAPPAPSACELDVSVLTSGFWPVVADPPCTLPQSVQAAASHFEAFYLSKHSGRRLRWATVKGSAEVRGTFGTAAAPRRHELSVSTYQMCVLLLFNDAEELSFRDVQAALGVGGAGELRRHVVSLLNPKCRILEKRSRGGGGVGGSVSTAALPAASGPLDLDDGDMLSVNADFTSKMVKVKVPLISAKSVLAVTTTGAAGGRGGSRGAAGLSEGVPAGGDGDGPDVPGQVEETRKHLVEAAIVRTMKTRKTMEHNSLVAEVIKQVSARFQPSPADVKRRIEGLIERDYMERDRESKGVYHYLA